MSSSTDISPAVRRCSVSLARALVSLLANSYLPIRQSMPSALPLATTRPACRRCSVPFCLRRSDRPTTRRCDASCSYRVQRQSFPLRLFSRVDGGRKLPLWGRRGSHACLAAHREWRRRRFLQRSEAQSRAEWPRRRVHKLQCNPQEDSLPAARRLRECRQGFDCSPAGSLGGKALSSAVVTAALCESRRTDDRQNCAGRPSLQEDGLHLALSLRNDADAFPAGSQGKPSSPDVQPF